MLKNIQDTWDRWFNKHRMELLFELSSEIVEWFCDVRVISATVKHKRTASYYTLYLKKATDVSLFCYVEERSNGKLQFESKHVSFQLNQNGGVEQQNGIDGTSLNRIAHCFLPLCDIVKLSSLAFKEMLKQKEKEPFENEFHHQQIDHISWDDETYPTLILKNQQRIPARDMYDDYLYRKSFVQVKP